MLGLGNGIPSGSLIEQAVLPTDLGDMVHYFKHKTGITIENGVSAWADQIGTANLAQTDDARKPAYNATTGALNFAEAETSANSNRLVFASKQSFTGAFSLFFAVKLDGGTSDDFDATHGFTSGSTNGDTSKLNFYDATATLANTFWQMDFKSGSGSASAVSLATNPDPLHSTKSLVVVTVSDTDGGTAKVYFGGNDSDANTINLAQSATLGGDKDFGIILVGHNDESPVRQMNSQLFEWGAYSKELSLSQVQTLFAGIKARGLID